MLTRAFKYVVHRLPIYRELLQIRNAVWAIRADVASLRASVSALRAIEVLRYSEAELRQNPRYQDPLRLHRYAFQVNSQNGEDGMIREIFRRIGTTNCIFVEIGVGNGIENNTAFLLAQGWEGFWIDSNDAFLRTIQARDDLRDGCLTPYVCYVDQESAAAIFVELGIPHDFDLLSIDVDQNTYYVWKALHAYRPRVVVIEYNAAIPPDVEWKARYDANRTWDGTQNYSASLKALELLGRQLGYSLVGCDFNGVNAFFVRNDLVADKFLEPFTAENHYEPFRYALLHRQGHPRAILDRRSEK